MAARAGHYTDAFATTVPDHVSLETYIAAFYTTPLFRLERRILGVFAGQPTSDADVLALARGDSSRIAFWRVAERRADEILLPVKGGRTMSWLRVVPVRGGTELWFGSVVTPLPSGALGPLFRVMLAPHVWYSRALLRSAARALRDGA